MLDLLATLDVRAVLVAAAAWLAATMVTLAIVAFVVVKLPAEHFVHRSGWRAAAARGVGGWLRLVARNLAGLALIALGAALALPGVPGQGVLTLLIGVMLLDVPGKRGLERWLVGRPGVLTTLNRLRARWGKPPLVPPTESRRCRA